MDAVGAKHRHGFFDHALESHGRLDDPEAGVERFLALDPGRQLVRFQGTVAAQVDEDRKAGAYVLVAREGQLGDRLENARLAARLLTDDSHPRDSQLVGEPEAVDFVDLVVNALVSGVLVKHGRVCVLTEKMSESM